MKIRYALFFVSFGLFLPHSAFRATGNAPAALSRHLWEQIVFSYAGDLHGFFQEEARPAS